MEQPETKIISAVFQKLWGILVLILLSETSCAQQRVQTVTGELKVETLANNLNHPWGMAFLPDGRLLVTERKGQLRILGADSSLSAPLEGVPEVYNKGHGGLLDVALDPNFQHNQLVYLSFSENGEGNTATTALGRGKLEGNKLHDFSIIFRQEPFVQGKYHFGGRIVFTPDGHLFLTLGERFKFNPAQELSSHLGTIVRINPDGSIPQDNPFVEQDNAKDAIWSYGHRNIEAAAIHPNSNSLWVAEMGPQGGDELNRPQAGENYGWPVVSWGEHYGGEDISNPPTEPRFADAVIHWTPVISPSGMLFYTGSMFPEWQGSALIGGLSAQGIVRVTIEGEDQASEVERIKLGARIRDVEQAPDGSVYVLTDQNNGNVWRLSPAD